MTNVVLDASAALAALNDEKGASEVWPLLPGAFISAVNAAEVATKLIDTGTAAGTANEFIQRLGLEVVPFEQVDVAATANLRQTTREAGLSLGDRACLALAWRFDMPAITADRQWRNVAVDVEIRLIR